MAGLFVSDFEDELRALLGKYGAEIRLDTHAGEMHIDLMVRVDFYEKGMDSLFLGGKFNAETEKEHWL